jgi:hypothetical protein
LSAEGRNDLREVSLGADIDVVGDSSVSIGRDASDNVIVTGHNNYVRVTQVTVIVADHRLHAPLRASDLEKGSVDNPYRGLDAFYESNADLFFGRRKMVRRAWTLFQKLQHGSGARILAVVGASGSGKSSLVRAGLIPELATQPLEGLESPKVLVLRPGPLPLARLAEILGRLSDVAGPSASSLSATSEVRAFDALHLFLSRLPDTEHSRFVIVVDQFEELFTECTDGDARRVFLENLAFAASAADKLVSIVITLRNDFLAAVKGPPAFASAVRGEGRLMIKPMDREELSEAVAQPAKKRERPWPATLVENLVAQAEGRTGALPLLQFALKRLWLDQVKDPLKEADWSSRLIEEFLVQAADELYKTAGHSDENRNADQRIIRQAFLAMVQLGEGTPDTRRVAALSEFVASEVDREHVRDLLAPFTATEARLVTASEQAGEPTYELTHEVLITSWDRLRAWLGDVPEKEDRERIRADLRLQRHLSASSKDWREGRPEDKESLLLPAGKRLTDATGLVLRRRAELPQSIVDYVDASQKNYEEKEAEDRRRRDASMARLAADEQRSVGYIKNREFAAAERELREIAGYLKDHVEADLAARAPEFAARWERIHRLARFFDGAREADTHAGEEDFEKALPKCWEALQYLGIEDPHWLDKLPTQDVADDPGLLRDLEQEAYRTLLLYSALQLVPGIRELAQGTGAVGSAPKGRSKLMTLAEPALPYLVPAFGPFLLRILAKKGGLGPLKLPTRQDRKNALAEFEKIQAALAKIRELEERFAARSVAGSREPSRTSQFVQRLVELFVELASPPKGAPINYRRWLLGGWNGPPPQPINAADYFFIGLLNYFVAKRHGTWIPKALTLVRGQFPDLDGKDPRATAGRLLRAAVVLEPRNFWAHWVLGRNLLTAKDYGGAELAFNSAILLRPVYARGYEQRALAIAHQWEKAGVKDEPLRNRSQTDSKTAREYANGDPSIFWPRGELLERLGNTAAALHSYARWLELEQDIPSLIARASGLDDLERLTTRLASGGLPFSASTSDLRADALAVRAHVRLVRKNYETARDDAEAALQLAPRQAHALTSKGMIILRLGRSPETALEPLDLSISLASSSNEPNYRALFERAKALGKIGEDTAALAAWRDLLAASEGSTCDRCPDWMRTAADAALARA